MGDYIMQKLPLVKDYMDTEVHTLKADLDIFSAVTFLLDYKVTSAPVVDADNHIVGILSEKDCLRLLSTGIDHTRPAGKVSDFMTQQVSWIEPNMNIYFAAGMFLNVSFRRFPVVENNVLVGAITRFDILRVIRERLA
jgi:CBS domain-containing protein